MEIELERTFLLKSIPAGLEECKSTEILDIYIPKSKDKFEMPEFCLLDVTQEKLFAGGILAGKKYSDIEQFLEKHNYKKIKNERTSKTINGVYI